ncbi:pep-cterm sorting domain-containing protein [Anaeramoeba ignava]|uniref:Pep-cterm sorting domain-containing protein n=1 Tax=Anaeramoeba ignava TaxID=1746090 RepID=A0A9Q0R740_ANAIG|nr:pep-cterm sorting domain-containing protein [Anaeramoeba ignava]
MDNNNNNQIQNANQNQNENEMKNLEKKVTKNLIKNYSNLLNGNSFKDFSIFVENKSNPFEIKVHKSILSSRSSFFNEIEKLKGKKEKEREIEKKRLFHSFFSLFDKDSISKQDFDKLKQFDIFLPKSFLIENKEKEIEENQKEIENKFIQENQQMKIEIEEKDKENQQMKPIFDKYQQKYQKYLEFEKKLEPIKTNFPQFSETRIITEEEYAKKLQEWINDNDFFSKMKKGFSTKRDGFDCENWHKAVDGKGKTLVIIKTKDNFIFGGFTQVGWTNDKSKWREEDRNRDDGFIPDSNAFIFSLRNDKGDRKPEKFTIRKEQEEYAIFYNLEVGPTFGSDIFFIFTLATGYSNFGLSYNLPNGIECETDEAKSYLAGSFNKWKVDEVETYFI